MDDSMIQMQRSSQGVKASAHIKHTHVHTHTYTWFLIFEQIFVFLVYNTHAHAMCVAR